jgi:hypothetical protein
MFAPERLKNLVRRTRPPFFDIIQALVESLLFVSACGNVEELLISFRILHDGRGFSSKRKYNRSLCFLQLFDQHARLAAKTGKGLSIFGYVEHDRLRTSSSCQSSKTTLVISY